MKKHVLLLLLGLSTAAPAFAQAPSAQQARPAQQQATAMPGTTAPKGNAKISGVILDAETNKPVEFATVALISVATGKPIDGTMADDKGKFTITKVAAGQYKLNVSFLGYKLQTVENVNVTSDNAEINIGSVALASDAKKLSEVVITGEKPLVEEKIDRTVYNAEKDLTNAGGNAADVLQKVPSLSVDTEGNVQLRGSSNVRVLINNKPSAIMAGNLADALKQIPADQIKSVEVITSPSAKYDAEGTAGIINIITKKDSGLQGVTGSFSLTGGNRNSNGNGSLNMKRGKLGINANFGGNMFYNRGDMTNTIIAYDLQGTEANEGNTSFQTGNTKVLGGFMNGQLGFDYEINQKNSISGGVRMNGGNFKMRNTQEVFNSYDPDETQTPDFTNRIKNLNQRLSTDLNLDFYHTFKKPGQELAILTLYSVTDTDNEINQDASPLYALKNTNDGANKELTFQVDYTHPFANKTMLEIGAKSIYRDVTSEADYLRTSAVANPSQTRSENDFFYEQDVYASYLTYGFTLKKLLNVKFGGRYEYTDINADLRTQGQGYTSDYDNFIPSVAFSYSLKNKHTFKLNFTQRIQRPSLFFLNPYVQQQTSNTRVKGNPNLDAELTDLYELGYSTYFKTSSLSLTAYMRQTDNAIETVPTYDPETQTTTITFANIAKNKTYGVSLFGNTKPTNALTIGGSSNIYYVDLNSSLLNEITKEIEKYSNSGWMYNINLNSSYDFGKGISAQFNGGFNSERIQLQGRFAAFSYHMLAFKKELFDKKGGISVGLSNPFRKSMLMKNDINALTYEQHVRINNYNRGVRVTFDYRFGKMEQQKPPRRKKSIRNDDAKQGEGNGVG